jgi:hypothetical protein
VTDSGIDSEQLEAAMRERWGDPDKIASLLPEDKKEEVKDELPELDLGLGDDVTDDDDDELTEPVVEDEVEPPAIPPVPSPPTVNPDLIPVGDGRYLTKAQIDYYAGIDARLGQDQAFRDHVAAYGKPAPKPATPPDIDLDDPNIKFLYEQNLELQRRIAQTGQVVTQTQQQQQEELANRTVALVNRAAASFQKEHELTDDQMKSLRVAAANMGAVNTYMDGRDPITNEPIPNPDILGAIDRALTIAFRARDDFVQESQDKTVRRQLDNKTRRQKLAKIGGNSGSQPRTPPVPTDAKGRREAMLAEVTAFMNGPQA